MRWRRQTNLERGDKERLANKSLYKDGLSVPPLKDSRRSSHILRNPLQIFGETTPTTTIVIGERKKERKKNRYWTGRSGRNECIRWIGRRRRHANITAFYKTTRQRRNKRKGWGGGRQKHTNQSPSSYLQGVKISTKNLRVESIAES